MGLGFDNADASWSYGGFDRFRTKLGEEIGVILNAMDTYGGNLSWDLVDHPIKDLLNHSDCDGILTPEQCATIAPALKAIVINWPEGDYDRQEALALVEGMIECAELKRDLEFC